MKGRWIRRLALLAGAGLVAGCTALREIPRDDFGARAERRACRLWTREGLVYDFDYAHVRRDTLVGFRERPPHEADGGVVSVEIPFEDIERFTARAIDWKRTGLFGAGVLTGVLVAGAARSGSDPPGDGGGGGLGGVDP